MTLYAYARLAWLRGRSDSPDDGIAWAEGQFYRVQDGRPEPLCDCDEHRACDSHAYGDAAGMFALGCEPLTGDES